MFSLLVVLEYLVVETLRSSPIVSSFTPPIREGGGAGADLIPRKRHQSARPAERRALGSLTMAGIRPSDKPSAVS